MELLHRGARAVKDTAHGREIMVQRRLHLLQHGRHHTVNTRPCRQPDPRCVGALRTDGIEELLDKRLVRQRGGPDGAADLEPCAALLALLRHHRAAPRLTGFLPLHGLTHGLWQEKRVGDVWRHAVSQCVTVCHSVGVGVRLRRFSVKVSGSQRYGEEYRVSGVNVCFAIDYN